MPFTASDICKIILAVILPPVGVFLEVGCGSHLLINILLTILELLAGSLPNVRAEDISLTMRWLLSRLHSRYHSRPLCDFEILIHRRTIFIAVVPSIVVALNSLWPTRPCDFRLDLAP
ncbi:hypothetical protein E4U19_001062 [Claviceps sp. Clav32 group G5]|nr:hypothetical protein E4U19_001062 [Claviceps sp. Clav32 group G5]KAG6050931.1 hypothetical protein E4U39_002671 [Claviceps sp. Clav50 group G5]